MTKVFIRDTEDQSITLRLIDLGDVDGPNLELIVDKSLSQTIRPLQSWRV